jgi:arsenate reductase
MAGALPTVLHNPNCGTSRKLLDHLTAKGVAVEVVNYVKNPLSEAQLTQIISGLDDPASAVRHDNRFRELGLDAADYQSAAAVVALLREHPLLMQRPIVSLGNRAVVARPIETVDDFLSRST